MYIDPSFESVVNAHLAGNLIVEPTESPLILGIFGPPGEGKTFQVDAVCKSLGLSVHIISPAELENENAGHPGQLIREQYLRAGGRDSSYAGVLVINDVDTVLGDWGALVQYTVNRQVVLGQLMALCDFPTEVAGNVCERVPIILTGNNPSSLYGPLLRPGRSRIFAWAPSAETRLPIVSSIFPELSAADVSKLVRKFADEPASFWADVRAALWESVMSDWIEKDGGANFSKLLSSGKKIQASSDVVTADSVKQMADKLVASDVRKRSFI